MAKAAAEPSRTAPNGSLINRLTTTRRLLVALGVILCFAIGAQARAVWQHDGLFYEGGEVPVGSDFFVFYSVGRLVAGGDGDQLYDLLRQQSEQMHVLGRDGFDGFLPFAYPAFFAAPYVPLAQLPFFWAYAIHTGFLLIAAAAAVAVLRPVSPTVRERPLLVTLAVLAWQPLMLATFGGLAAALSLLCLSGGYAALRRERDVAAGVWLGLLLYKPQLVALVLVLLLWRRRWRTVAAAGAVGLSLALVGVAVAGPTWPWRFLALVGGDFYETEATTSGNRMISLLAVTEQIFGVQSATAQWIAGTLGLGAVALLLVAWRGARPVGDAFPLQYGLAITVSLLLSPHALFYEASLLFLPILALVDRWRGDAPGLSPRQRLGLVSLFLAGSVWPLGGLLGVQPLAVLPVAIGFVLWRERSHRRSVPAHSRRTGLSGGIHLRTNS